MTDTRKTTAASEQALRDKLKAAIDDMPAVELLAARRYFQFAHYSKDPLCYGLDNAPLDDEEVTEEDIAAFVDTEEDFIEGNTYTHEEMMKEFGL